MIVRVAVVSAVTDVNPVGVKTNVPAVVGLSVIVLVQVAPAGTLKPPKVKAEPVAKLLEEQGDPTEKELILLVPAGKGILSAPPLTAELPVFLIVIVNTTEPAEAVTLAALSEVDTVAVAAVVVVVVVLEDEVVVEELPLLPPPPQAARSRIKLAAKTR